MSGKTLNTNVLLYYANIHVTYDAVQHCYFIGDFAEVAALSLYCYPGVGNYVRIAKWLHL